MSERPARGREDEEEDRFAATAIISAVDMPEAEAPQRLPLREQDDVLNEVDVYLAYGLYDNAEDLLNSSLVENPDRADYRSKLLDTYFATKKSDAFRQGSAKPQEHGRRGQPLLGSCADHGIRAGTLTTRCSPMPKVAVD